ncbi:unnamed protein product [Orchesella dallaii]|uniref:Phorbol-ester/DAG-type domain-containing protein n=1 Tax=Orchesella dallaii TaxID=48710 RepID=A0ABP1QU84_9HEXA
MKERLCCGQPAKSKKVAPTVSAPLHLILRAPSPASHEWKRVPGVKRLCQVCHLAVDGEGVSCKSCGFKAHSQCSFNYHPANFNLNLFHHRSNNTTCSDRNCSELHSHHNNNNPSSSLSQRGVGNNNLHYHHHHTLVPQGLLRRQPEFAHQHFEPRIKKLLHVPLLTHSEEGGGSCESAPEQHSGGSRFSSSCGDSVAASTAIVVVSCHILVFSQLQIDFSSFFGFVQKYTALYVVLF